MIPNPDPSGSLPAGNPPPVQAHTSLDKAEDVLSIVDKLGYERFHLVGHDWGGGVAWTTALLNQERISSLAIISRPHPRAFGRSLKEDPEQSQRSSHHKNNRKRGVTSQMLANDAQRLREGFTRSGVPDADAAAYLETLNNYETLDAATNWYRALYLSEDLFKNLGAFRRPTLYVWGNKDGAVGRYAAELTAEYVDAPYKFVELDGVGHFVTDQVPDAFPPLLLEHVCAN